MKLEYRIIEVTKGSRWSCNFCSYDKGKSSTATHEMVARKPNGYADVAYICKDCKKDFDNNILPWCEKCGRVKRNRISCFRRLVEDQDTEPVSEETIIAQAYSSRLESKIKELEKELAAAKVEINTHLEALQVSEGWSKVKVDRIKELETEVARLKEENKQLKEQQNGHLTAQIEVKEVKKWPWAKTKK